MSYVFVIDDVTVWSPALRVGALYHRYVTALEEAVGVNAGFTEFASDFLIIDRQQHAAFTDAVRTWLGSEHPIANALTRPVLAISLAMLRRSSPLDETDADLLAEIQQYSASMPD